MCINREYDADKILRESRSGLKTAITIIAELIRSLILSGLAAAAVMLGLAAVSATTGYCLWRLWQKTRR